MEDVKSTFGMNQVYMKGKQNVFAVQVFLRGRGGMVFGGMFGPNRIRCSACIKDFAARAKSHLKRLWLPSHMQRHVLLRKQPSEVNAVFILRVEPSRKLKDVNAGVKETLYSQFVDGQWAPHAPA